MRITYNWLKDFVEIKISPKQLADKLTIAGLEVTNLEKRGADFVLEMEITSNRPDCLSVVGIAREVAAITKSKIKNQKSKIQSKIQDLKKEKNSFKIEIQDKKGCSLYIAKIIKDVKVAPSPEWLKQRLEAIGIRPVNNIVDITNYCLMETGQPLHAFDFDKLEGRSIIVRRARNNEKLITIDGIERPLNSGILVIADTKKPIAIAGIMGGKETEVNWETKNILLESAYFEPQLIRRASRALGLASDSSYRFERNVDKTVVSIASQRAVDLISRIANGKLSFSIGCLTSKKKEKDRKVILTYKEVNDLLGGNIPNNQIRAILSRLFFKIKASSKDSLRVEAPTFRQDITKDVDLIEELARIYGYDRLPISLPVINISQIEQSLPSNIEKIIRAALINLGLNEVITYSLVSKEFITNTNLPNLALTKIANPLSTEQEFLRPSLLPGLTTCLVNNFRHNTWDMQIFEMGKIYLAKKELSYLGMALTGSRSPNWLSKSREEVNLLDFKGILETLLRKLGITNFEFIMEDSPPFTKGNSVKLKIENNVVGEFGEIAIEALIKWDIKQKAIFLGQINLEDLVKFINLEKKLKPLVNQPSIRRDISLIIKNAITSKEVVGAIRENAPSLLKEVSLIDYYIGSTIPSGFKGLTYSLEYQALDRTLRDEEVDSIHNKICAYLIERLQARIR